MDLKILEWINNNLHGSGFINNVMKYITSLGETGIIWIVLGLILLIPKKTRKGGFFLLCGIVATGVVNNLLLKNIINRARPFTHSQSLADFITGLGLELPDSPSFPSGHTFSSFCSATILTFAFGKKGAWSFIPASLISLSRVFLCVHYPTDVLAGAVIGSAVGVGVYYLAKFVINKLDEFILNKRQKKNHKSKDNVDKLINDVLEQNENNE